MANLMWLPPLNIPVNSTTIIAETVEGEIEFEKEPPSSSSISDEKLTNPFWAITLDVCVNFCGETDEPPIIMGLNYLSKPIVIPSDELNASSMEEAEKFLFTKISQELRFHSRLCSTLSDCLFTTCSSKSSSSPLEIKFCRWVADLLRIPSIGGTDGSRVTLPPVTLKIWETVNIKNDVYREWLCWYNTSKTTNIEFEREYIAAISRPRTLEEIGYESLFMNRKQALTAVLKDKNRDLDDKCSICLEELSIEEKIGGLKSLECGHIFHGDCIKKWLLPNIITFGSIVKNSPTCPLCRCSLHAECTEILWPCNYFRQI